MNWNQILFPGSMADKLISFKAGVGGEILILAL